MKSPPTYLLTTQELGSLPGVSAQPEVEFLQLEHLVFCLSQEPPLLPLMPPAPPPLPLPAALISEGINSAWSPFPGLQQPQEEEVLVCVR